MKKWYLPDGAELTADFAEVKLYKGVMCFDGWGNGCKYFYKGLEVDWDYDTEQYFVMSDIDPDTL